MKITIAKSMEWVVNLRGTGIGGVLKISAIRE